MLLAVVDIGGKLPLAVKHIVSTAWMDFRLWAHVSDMSKKQWSEYSSEIVKDMFGKYSKLFITDFFNDLMSWPNVRGNCDDHVSYFIDNALWNVVRAKTLLPDVNKPLNDLDAFGSMLDNVQQICCEIGTNHKEWLSQPKEWKVYDS